MNLSTVSKIAAAVPEDNSGKSRSLVFEQSPSKKRARMTSLFFVLRSLLSSIIRLKGWVLHRSITGSV